MAASPIIGSKSKLEFFYILYYRLRILAPEEKKDWLRKWAKIRKNLPKGIRIITEAGNAFGTDFTGFTIFEGPFRKFEELIEAIRIQSVDFIERIQIIIGTKGLVTPSAELEKILKSRPID